MQLWAGEDSVGRTFEEIAAIAVNCRYRDCSHSGEQGCAVEAALASGEIASERWESYRKLMGEARRHEVLTDRMAAQEQKRKWKQIHKAARQQYKMRGLK